MSSRDEGHGLRTIDVRETDGVKTRRILFAMHFETGHTLCTFRLARALQAKGHTVIYLTIPDFQSVIESHGFASILFAENILPLHSTETAFDGTAYARYLERITDGTLDRCILAARPDILLCDPFLSYVAIRAISLGVPTVSLFTSLFLYENPSIPPVTTSRFPGSAWKTVMAWKMMFLKYFFTKRLKSRFRNTFRSPTKMQHLVDEYLTIARKSGYPCVKNASYRLNEIGLNLVLPEIVFCPQAFQFPAAHQDQRVYLGNFVDRDRKETPLALDTGGRPLVYCSLGTAADTYPHADRFFRAVAQAAAQRQDWYFVLQISDPKAIRRYPSTDNLLVTPWVPQLSVLRRASVMVTHGGLNSIMECVLNKVPMVIVPGLRDQPGNAARAVFHNLALMADMKRLEPAGLVRLIENAVTSQDLKAGLERMRQAMEEEDGLSASVAFIESRAMAEKQGATG